MGFVAKLSEIINTGQSRAIILTGNIYDLFFDGQNYVPIVQMLNSRYDVKPNITTREKGLTRIVYEINDNIIVFGEQNLKELCAAWEVYMASFPEDQREDTDLRKLMQKSRGNPTYSLELLRKISLCARAKKIDNNLLIIIEGADILMPENELNRMNIADRQRIAIVHDWFSDPTFVYGHDTVILLSESRSQLHQRVSKLPQVMEVEVLLPNLEEREAFILKTLGKMPESCPNLAQITAALSLHALKQLLAQKKIDTAAVTLKVEQYLKSLVGEEAIKFKRPVHSLDDARGNSVIRKFLKTEVIPSFKGPAATAITGLVFGGPIGGGKTWLGEGLVGDMGIPAIELVGLRSMWLGQTDLIVERLFRAITALDQVAIFIDEADTQFREINPQEHSTEVRMTGKIQNYMSDERLKGKVFWILMTARIHLLSPDIRREGRAGDLIIPVLDPSGKDLEDFIEWVAESVEDRKGAVRYLQERFANKEVSAATFANLRKQIKRKEAKLAGDVKRILDDMIPPNIADVRDYQKYQALLNTTRKSLLPVEFQDEQDDMQQHRKGWQAKIRELEEKGIR
jgi:hypothetical protein